MLLLEIFWSFVLRVVSERVCHRNILYIPFVRGKLCQHVSGGVSDLLFSFACVLIHP